MHEVEGFSAKTPGTSLFNYQNAWLLSGHGPAGQFWIKESAHHDGRKCRVKTTTTTKRQYAIPRVSLLFIFWRLFVLRADPRYLKAWNTQANPSDELVFVATNAGRDRPLKWLVQFI